MLYKQNFLLNGNNAHLNLKMGGLILQRMTLFFVLDNINV